MCVCEQLAHSCYLTAERLGVKPATSALWLVDGPTVITDHANHHHGNVLLLWKLLYITVCVHGAWYQPAASCAVYTKTTDTVLCALRWLTSMLPYLAHAVVGEFDVTLGVQQHVVQLQVTIHNAWTQYKTLSKCWDSATCEPLMILRAEFDGLWTQFWALLLAVGSHRWYNSICWIQFPISVTY